MTRCRPSPGALPLTLFSVAALLSCVDPGMSAPSAITNGPNGTPPPPGVVPVDPCLDGDGDGFGVACRPGPDCDDQDPAVTNQCTACLRPNTGCPCAEGSVPIGCNVATGDNTLSPEGVCRLGQRVCRDGVWSACEALASNARFLSAVSACYGMCDPGCRHFVECPEATDVLPTDSTNVEVSNLPPAVFCPGGVGLGGIQPNCEPRPGDTYARSTSPANWIDACAAPGRTVILAAQDDASATVTLPFPFAFWGIPYRTVQPTSNGVLQFATTVSSWVNTTLPAPSVPNAIFPFWDDLLTRTGVCVATVGAVGDRRTIFEWEDATTWPGDAATHLTFEVILGERDQTIDVLYYAMQGPTDRATGDSATIGVQQSVGTRFDLVSSDTAGAVSAGTALRWSPDTNAQYCLAGTHRRTFNAVCARDPSGVPTVPTWGRLNYSALVPPGAAIRLYARAADTAAGLATATPIRLPDAPTTNGAVPLTQGLDLGDILQTTMRGLAHRPFVQLAAEFDPGVDAAFAPRLGGLELQYHCEPVEDPYHCTPGSACQLPSPCRRGALICPYTYGGECRDVGALPVGTSCGSGSVCNSAGNCVTCAEGTACDTGNVCTFGRISCATGAPVCVVAGNRPPGTPCAFATGNYTRSTSPLGFIDACELPGAQVLLSAVDDGTATVTLPFPFRFYGTQRTSMGVSVNGAIGFPTVTTAWTNATLPLTSLPDSILPFWDDLQLRPAGICTATVGSAPDRLFVTQWSNADFQDRGVGGDQGASLNFEVVLAEATQAVHVLYGDMVGDARATGSSATVGIQQGGSATRFDLFTHNTAGRVAANSSILWTPPSTSACTGTGVCSPCTTAEICDGIDNNCNGLVDDGIANLTCGVGACRRTVSACVRAAAQTCVPGTPSAEVCNGIDDDCDGMVDEACMGTITCPGDASMFAGDSRSFSVTTMGMLSNFSWSIVTAPSGGATSAVWTPAPPRSTTETFRPIIVGVYRLRVQGTDGLGQVRSCEFNVTANSRGLRAELTWNGTGDVDIHMHNNVSGPWFNIPNDCHYRNLTPAWGAAQDVDNVTANGPENIRVNTPTVGQTYRIGVHNYANGRNRTATLRIYCGPFAGTTPSVTYTSTPLQGTSVGNCTANTWWDVADVTINPDGTCVIAPINTYRASSAACTTR